MRAFQVGIIAVVALGLTAVELRTAEAACSKYREVETTTGKPKKVPRVGKPERRFGGKVLLSTKAFPTYARSVNSYINKVRKRSKKKFWEDKEKKQWKIHFIAFFRRPLDDMEVTIKLWDLSKGQKRMVSSFDQFLKRCSTSYASSMKLERERFGVNKQLLITVARARSRKVIAAGKFRILGEAKKYTGKADFSDEIVEADKPEDKDAKKAKETKNEPHEEEAPPPLPGEEKVDYTDESLLDTPDLEHEEEMEGQRPPEQRKADRGCGCRARGSDAAGGMILLALVGLALVRRRND